MVTVRRSCFSIIRLSQVRNKPYIYYDVTPDGEDNRNNCVTRAITLASGLPYGKVRELLERNAVCNACDELTVSCYDNLLEDYFGYERYDCDYHYTVQEVADMYADDVVLMRLDGHLTCSVRGCVCDIFDCTNEPVDCYWVVGRE